MCDVIYRPPLEKLSHHGFIAKKKTPDENQYINSKGKFFKIKCKCVEKENLQMETHTCNLSVTQKIIAMHCSWRGKPGMCVRYITPKMSFWGGVAIFLNILKYTYRMTMIRCALESPDLGQAFKYTGCHHITHRKFFESQI